MENKTNIAEILRNCPQGMELDCTICNNAVTLEGVDTADYYPIKVVSKSGFHHVLTCEGYVYAEGDAKCVIFPKGKTTWEGFVPPCKFKDGDIVVCGASRIDEYVCIFKIDKAIDTFYYHAMLALHSSRPLFKTEDWALSVNIRLATEEEKQKLFQAIKANGFKWNEKTKTLEKLVEPIFKVWDKIRLKNNKNRIEIINCIFSDSYGLCSNHLLFFNEQDDWELVPNKFDINTLKPFESRVLMRDYNNSIWLPALWGIYNDNDNSDYPYKLVGTMCRYCIPYEGNQHLLGTSNDCDEYYKTWK